MDSLICFILFLTKIVDFGSDYTLIWQVFSPIVLAITAALIWRQAYWTRKYTEFAVMPNAFFILKSIKGANDKDTCFIVQNNSKFPILFKVKIDYIYNNQKVKSSSEHWDKPLYVFPSIMSYPNVVFLKDIECGDNSQIIADITYSYTPEFASNIKVGPFQTRWTFDKKEKHWIGPNGVREENL